MKRRWDKLKPFFVHFYVENELSVAVLPNATVMVRLHQFLEILENIIGDWELTVSDYDSQINEQPNDEKDRAFSYLYLKFETRYIQYLFSYITFFLSVEHGLQALYSELNRWNKKLNLNVKHGKPPKHPPLFEKLKLVRDTSVAHWADPKIPGDVESRAGEDWGMVIPQDELGRFVFSGVIFGNVAVPKAQDRRLPPLGEIHAVCTHYIAEFDDLCDSYLTAIRQRLPVTIDDREYFVPPTKQ